MYGEAHARFDGALLWLTFPDDQDFYVGMVRDSKHTDILMEAFEAIIGTRPSEIRAGIWNTW